MLIATYLGQKYTKNSLLLLHGKLYIICLSFRSKGYQATWVGWNVCKEQRRSEQPQCHVILAFLKLLY
jgi:hypothetical protein